MAGGRIVADGPATEIKGRAGTSEIRATLPEVPEAELAAVPGVISARRIGQAVALTCSDPDTAARTLLQRYPALQDIRVSGAGLEDAFLHLTDDAGTADGSR